MPTTISLIDAPTGEAGFTRTFELARGMMMRWTIDGRVFEMDRALFSTTSGAKETWEVANVEASMPHPMHLHGLQFRVLERRRSPQQALRLAVADRGRQPTDLGLKDTVLVWPVETVVLATNNTNAAGKGTADLAIGMATADTIWIRGLEVGARLEVRLVHAAMYRPSACEAIWLD